MKLEYTNKKWKAEKICCPGNFEQFMGYLFVKTAPVFLGAKPSVLFRLCKCPNHEILLRKYDLFCIYEKRILHSLKMDCHIMKKGGNNIQILFYDRKLLNQTIVNPENRLFLLQKGYDVSSPETCLKMLEAKFSGKEFPHELGIFLGYPLKDVIGFIENREVFAGYRGGLWKIYGDVAESLSLMEAIKRAERLALKIVHKIWYRGFSLEEAETQLIKEYRFVQ